MPDKSRDESQPRSLICSCGVVSNTVLPPYIARHAVSQNNSMSDPQIIVLRLWEVVVTGNGILLIKIQNNLVYNTAV